MGVLIAIAVGAVIVGGLGYLLYHGGQAEKEFSLARSRAVRRRATVLSSYQVEKPKPTASHGSMGLDRRRVFLTIHVPDGDDYQAEPVWSFEGGTDDLEDGQSIDVEVHCDKPWIVWPTLPHTKYKTGDLASVFYGKEPPTPAARQRLSPGKPRD